jgi:predicted DNA-binding transcriptional regulator YafY
VDANVLATLAAACRDQLEVGFAYRDMQGRSSTRKVEPQGLVHASSRWYLVAWDPARDDWHTFRIDRVEDAPVIGAHFAPRPGPGGGDLGAYVSGMIAVTIQGEEARVVLHKPLDTMSPRIPPAAALLEPIDESRCLLRCPAHQLDWLVYWLMSLDVEFEVLEPTALKERLRAAGERVARALTASAR